MEVISSGNTNRFLQKQITMWGQKLIFLSQYHPSIPKLMKLIWFIIWNSDFVVFFRTDFDVLYEKGLKTRILHIAMFYDTKYHNQYSACKKISIFLDFAYRYLLICKGWWIKFWFGYDLDIKMISCFGQDDEDSF